MINRRRERERRFDMSWEYGYGGNKALCKGKYEINVVKLKEGEVSIQATGKHVRNKKERDNRRTTTNPNPSSKFCS